MSRKEGVTSLGNRYIHDKYMLEITSQSLKWFANQRINAWMIELINENLNTLITIIDKKEKIDCSVWNHTSSAERSVSCPHSPFSEGTFL